MSVEFKDLGIGKLKEQLAELRQTQITIGYQGASGKAKHSNADVPVAQVAAWMEYGTEDVPARPFLRQTLKVHGKQFAKASKSAMSDLIDGRSSLEEAQDLLGESAVDALRSTIDDARDWAEPLADSTVKAKGFSNPLIETGEMRASASWAVRRGGTIVRQGGER